MEEEAERERDKREEGENTDSSILARRDLKDDKAKFRLGFWH